MPQPPAFLNGPMALLLTNVDGFRAHVVLESGASATGVEVAEGELMGRGGKLVFAPGQAAPPASAPPGRAPPSSGT